MPSRFTRFRVPQKYLPVGTSGKVDALFAARDVRGDNVRGGMAKGFAAGIFGGIGAAEVSNARQKILLALGLAAAGAGIGAISGFWKSRKLVRAATIEVGKALCAEWEGNKFIESMVTHYPYLIVGENGEIIGAKTNIGRLGIGRLRLVTEKIRNGTYMEERGPAPKVFRNFNLDRHGAQSLVRIFIGARNAGNAGKIAEISGKLAEQLAKEALRYRPLEDFLTGTRYFFIDKKGDMVASRTDALNKFGLGRQRFSSKDVLEELERLRWWAKNFPRGQPPQ